MPIATVNGRDMYYEIHGAGRPLVLLHGAFSMIETDFGAMLPSLARTRKVIGVEQQGHGRTPDVDAPLDYDRMADDTAGLLRTLKIAEADLFGYSMGGAVALRIARRHPELVGKVVFAGGACFTPDGFYPEMLAGFDQMTPHALDSTPWHEAYVRVAPRPERWGDLVMKMKRLDTTFAGWPAEDVRAIGAPVLLIVGDSDIVRPEHVVEMFRLLGGGVAGDIHGLPRAQLAVLPGTTHVTVMRRHDWLVSMTAAFLGGGA